MLRRMNQSAVLGLFDDEADAAAKAPLPAPPPALPMVPAAAAVAQSESPSRRRLPPLNPAPMTTLICDCNKTMPIDGPALAPGPRA